jgi:hypothetical protein
LPDASISVIQLTSAPFAKLSALDTALLEFEDEFEDEFKAELEAEEEDELNATALLLDDTATELTVAVGVLEPELPPPQATNSAPTKQILNADFFIPNSHCFKFLLFTK